MEVEPLDQVPEILPVPPKFTVAHQKVDLEIDFGRQIRGRTEIVIYPESKDVKTIKLHAQQCSIENITVNKVPVDSFDYDDPCDQLCLHTESSASQHHLLSAKLQGAFRSPAEESLTIDLPSSIRINDVNLAEVHTQTAGTIKISKPDENVADTAQTTQGLSDTTVARYTPLTVIISFSSVHVRDALQFVTGSGKWPHVYTRGGFGGARASCLFPCVDTINSRCTWEISVKGPRTVGDATRQATGRMRTDGDGANPAHEDREMLILCTGDITDEIVDKADSSKKTVSFACMNPLSAQQLGLAVGPFDQVNLSELRDAQEMEGLGKNVVEMTGYCLPGRVEEVKNTCLPTTMAMDFFIKTYIACPYPRFGMCFVEDMHSQPSTFAELAICSTRMLYPEEVIDPAQDVTRSLVHAIASQWIGVNIIAEEPRDMWVIIGASHFMTDLFMKDLCGNNEYRYRMKKQSDQIVELDVMRPSLHEMGAILHVDPSVYDFMALKCPVVFYILDRRMAKVTGTGKMQPVLAKILTRARTDDLQDNALSTDLFQKQVERFYHQTINDFMVQWVFGAGCPRFIANQRFNKKKLVIELMLRQVQSIPGAEQDLEVDTFMRDVREDFNGVWAAEPQKVFTGPMTIRIHEADGTPYEHIIDIKEAQVTVEIPYNTKYKRLKRTKKQKSRAAAKPQDGVDEENDALLYCLGDVLQGEEDIASWKLTEWTAEEEQLMNSESFEWMRIDADFEWIASTKLHMPGYMFVSQLQQDRDVAAQLQSVQNMWTYPPNPLISTILLRTMMDSRYFHGIRATAAEGLVKHAKKEVNYIGLFHLRRAFEVLYCTSENNSTMTRPNDFSNQLSYFLQCAIVEAISQVRDDKNKTPNEVKDFLLDKLKFNDNSNNDCSDAYYVSRLMKALTTALLARPEQPRAASDQDVDMEAWTHFRESQAIEQSCLDEIDRYRRMDEWTSSYQNLYSRTAIACQARLARADIGSFSPLHFLQYTRPGNYDMLRVTAYGILMQSNVFENTSILRYIIHCMTADTSPYVRECLTAFFGKALAREAIGEGKIEAQVVGAALVIEANDQENLDIAQKEKARRQTIEGAMEALKKELGNNESLKKFLWTSVCHPEIGFEDLKALLEFCRLLYNPVDEARVALKLPKYWRIQNLGKGKLRFSQTNRVRTRRVDKWKPKTLAPPPPPPLAQGDVTSQPVKIKFKSQKQSSSTPTPPPAAALRKPSVPQPTNGRIVLKLKKQGSE